MTEDKEESLTVSRKDLHELAWSKPVRELAMHFGSCGPRIASAAWHSSSMGAASRAGNSAVQRITDAFDQ